MKLIQAKNYNGIIISTHCASYQELFFDLYDHFHLPHSDLTEEEETEITKAFDGEYENDDEYRELINMLNDEITFIEEEE